MDKFTEKTYLSFDALPTEPDLERLSFLSLETDLFSLDGDLLLSLECDLDLLLLNNAMEMNCSV